MELFLEFTVSRMHLVLPPFDRFVGKWVDTFVQRSFIELKVSWLWLKDMAIRVPDSG
jgi:hypothetical protein